MSAREMPIVELWHGSPPPTAVFPAAFPATSVTSGSRFGFQSKRKIYSCGLTLSGPSPSAELKKPHAPSCSPVKYTRFRLLVKGVDGWTVIFEFRPSPWERGRLARSSLFRAHSGWVQRKDAGLQELGWAIMPQSLRTSFTPARRLPHFCRFVWKGRPVYVTGG